MNRIEAVKDLTPELQKLESKDRFYLVKGKIIQLLAPQDPLTTRPFIYRKTGWGTIERLESHAGGTPTTETAPRRKRTIRKGEAETKTGICWTFGTNGKKEVLIPWAGSFGIFKSAWRRTLEAKAILRYENPRLDLIKAYPKSLILHGPIDSQANGQIPLVVLTKRNTFRGQVMVEEFFDWLKNRPIEFYIEVDSESPINEEKLVGMLKSLNTLDSFGPSKRGELEINEITQVTLTQKEFEQLRGNPPN